MGGTPENRTQKITKKFVCEPDKCAVFAFLNEWKDELPEASKLSKLPKVSICRHQHQFLGEKRTGGCGQSFTGEATILMGNTQ